MSKELFNNYRKQIENVKKSAKARGLSDNEIEILFKKSLINLENDSSSNCTTFFAKFKEYSFITLQFLVVFLTIAFTIYIVLNVHQTTSSIVLRNVQGLIYPGLKFVRALSVPIITLFPSLTDLNDESCLVENPLFYVSDMECWPCNSVQSVIDLTKSSTDDYKSLGSGIPMIMKTEQKLVTFAHLRDLYLKNRPIFATNRIKSTNSSIQNLDQLFHTNSSIMTDNIHLHATWRINKMLPARIIRGLFPKPFFISKWSGQSVERFVMIDGAKAEAYSLPNMECSLIFAIQGSGERTIVFKPSSECSRECKTVSVVLKPSYVLWYNWWYWRPISLPTANASGPSITYISSYCE